MSRCQCSAKSMIYLLAHGKMPISARALAAADYGRITTRCSLPAGQLRAICCSLSTMPLRRAGCHAAARVSEGRMKYSSRARASHISHYTAARLLEYCALYIMLFLLLRATPSRHFGMMMACLHIPFITSHFPTGPPGWRRLVDGLSYTHRRQAARHFHSHFCFRADNIFARAMAMRTRRARFTTD